MQNTRQKFNSFLYLNPPKKKKKTKFNFFFPCWERKGLCWSWWELSLQIENLLCVGERRVKKKPKLVWVVFWLCGFVCVLLLGFFSFFFVPSHMKKLLFCLVWKKWLHFSFWQDFYPISFSLSLSLSWLPILLISFSPLIFPLCCCVVS